MQDYKLEYASPAATWFEALPLGNGSLGAMISGRTDVERIGLNLDSLWSGTGRDKGNKSERNWDELREMIRNKQFAEAEEYSRTKILGHWTESYLPAGELILKREGATVKNYHRSLTLNTGIARTCWQENDVLYQQTAFTSLEDQVLVILLEAYRADTPVPIKLQVSLETQLHVETVSTGETPEQLVLSGRAPVVCEPSYHTCDEPIRYEEGKGTAFMLGVRAAVGTVVANERELQVTGDGAVCLVLAGVTSFMRENANLRAEITDILSSASTKTPEELIQAQDKAFRSWFDRVDFSLDEADENGGLTLNRVKSFADNKQDITLVPLLFQYGRYLMIASSQPGTEAANLQGIWNPYMQAPWSSNYTVNINTEMNYWPAESTGLGECCLPLFDLIDKTAQNGTRTAKDLYGLDGWVSHHNVDGWGHSTPVGGPQGGNPSSYALWPMSSGWLCRHLWEHYLYTLDKEFLKKTAMPLMEGAVRFYLGYLTEEGEYLVTNPSTSPENSFLDDKGENHAVFMASTMDLGILKDLFSAYLQACDILGTGELLTETEAALNKLPPFKIGRDGELMEWYENFQEAEIHHRHISHLYALYPAAIIDERTPDLEKACQVTLNRRGDEGTGWCLAWRAACHARLRDGDRAYKLLKNQMRLTAEEQVRTSGGGIYANLFCAHPPFQIDGNFGYTAAVSEMLLQSQSGFLDLLPALPVDWKNGHVCGMKARGGYTVNFSWKEHRITELSITAMIPGAVTVRIGEKTLLLQFTKENLEQYITF